MAKDGRIDMVLELTTLNLDHTQIRHVVNMNLVRHYSERAAEGDRFPPLDVTHDAKKNVFYLTDGFHRYFSAQQLGKDKVRCAVKAGTKKDAIIEAALANHMHGEPLNARDRRRAVTTLLYHMPEATDKQIADWSHVGVKYVAECRHELKSGETVGMKKIKKIKKKMKQDDKEEQSLTPIEVLNRRKVESDEQIMPILKRLSELHKSVLKLEGKLVSPFFQVPEIESAFKQLRRIIGSAIPYKICPYCSGDRCDGCRRSGWVPRNVWLRAPKELLQQRREEDQRKVEQHDRDAVGHHGKTEDAAGETAAS